MHIMIFNISCKTMYAVSVDFYLIRCIIDRMWQSVSFLGKFMLYPGCGYAVLSTCVNIVNTIIFILRGNNCFSLFRIPFVHENLFDILSMQLFQLNCSLKLIIRKFNSNTLNICVIYF